jgi:hypothetical protein
MLGWKKIVLVETSAEALDQYIMFMMFILLFI